MVIPLAQMQAVSEFKCVTNGNGKNPIAPTAVGENQVCALAPAVNRPWTSS